MEAVAWARQNTQKLVVGIAAAVILVGGLVYYVGFREDQDVRAANELDQIQQTLVLGDPASAAGRLNQFIASYSGTSSEGEARLILGQLHLEEAEPDQAIQALAPLARDLGNPLGVQGAFLLGAAYEDAGQNDDAEDLYLRIANSAELEFQVRNALESAARIRTSQGNFAGAEELLQEILDGMEESDPARAGLEMRLSELQHLQRSA